VATLKLRSLVNSKSAGIAAVSALCNAMGNGICITDPGGRALFGDTAIVGVPSAYRAPVTHEGTTLGFVLGALPQANALALLLSHLAARESEGRALASEVLHLYREVNLIEQLSEQLAAVLDLSAVGHSALGQAQRLIPAMAGSIHIAEKERDSLRSVASFGGFDLLAPGSRFAATVLERGIGEIVNDCATDPRAIDQERQLTALMIAPLRAGQRTVGVIALASTAQDGSYTAADLKLLNTIALQTAAAIENSLLCAEMVSAVRDREQLAAIQNELDTARNIQHLLVPRTFPPFPDRTDFELHAQMTSARAVGGDFFDFFLIDQDRLGLVIGDVSGKGIPAALYMAVTRTQIKTTALRSMPPAECLQEVNRHLVRERVGSMFSTCFYGLFDLRSGTFEYCSAGHNPAYLLRSRDNTIHPLSDVGGIPLGLFDGMDYIGSTAHLEPGDALFLYTDGVPEAQNRAEEDFSDGRLIDALQTHAKLCCRDIITQLTREVLAFTKGAPQSDDITMLSIRRLTAAGST
jgi:sigma-B regulation protein RsbU (phosphoserine phosphatase)